VIRLLKQLHKNSIYSAKYQHGAVFIETILTLPILLVFTLGMLDLGSWFMKHYVASRIVYEAARTGASLSDIKDPAVSPSNNHCMVENASGSLGSTFAYDETGHYVMMSRMKRLLQSHAVTIPDVLLNTCFNSDERYIEASISIPFIPITVHFFNWYGWWYDNTPNNNNFWPPIKAKARAPYLYGG